MKNLLLYAALIVTTIMFSQNDKRTSIDGKIVVENSDIGGITIYNLTSKKGTFTDPKGEFSIDVTLNDTLQIKSLKHENFDLVVNKSNVESKLIKIYLIEEINILDEVVVYSNKLSGNIKSDIDKLKVFKPKSEAFYFSMKPLNLETNTNKIENTAFSTQDKPMVNGLNIINVVDQLLLPLFRSEVSKDIKVNIPEVPAKSIKYYLGSEFLVNNFNIPEHRVEEFIRYVESKNFDFNLLNYGHEMEFLEVLNAKSKLFLNQ